MSRALQTALAKIDRLKRQPRRARHRDLATAGRHWLDKHEAEVEQQDEARARCLAEERETSSG